jgi:predicted nucleotidyltransferase
MSLVKSRTLTPFEGKCMTKAIILSFLAEHKGELQDKFGIQKIALFGSYAKGTANDNSDIDIAIETKEKDFFIRDDLREYLEEHLKKSVDVGYLDSFREFYRQKIERDLIYV